MSKKSESLGKSLPPAPVGWTRSEGDDPDGTAGGLIGMFGSGASAYASYTRGEDEMSVTLIADAPMITGMAGMLAGITGLGGKPLRIQRTEFAMNEKDLQGVVDGRILVSVGGNASIEDKTALIQSMDLGRLADY